MTPTYKAKKLRGKKKQKIQKSKLDIHKMSRRDLVSDESVRVIVVRADAKDDGYLSSGSPESRKH